jgi:hypothetical protein
MARDPLAQLGLEAPSEDVAHLHRDYQRGKQDHSEERTVDVVQVHAGVPGSGRRHHPGNREQESR